MTVLLAAPTATPEVERAQSEWVGLRPTWTGWDGSKWDFASIQGGVMLLRGGVRGWSMPPVEHKTSQSPAVAGSMWRGYRVAEREVFWPLYVWRRDGSQAWIEHDRAFWRTMHPGKTGVWSVTHPDGTVRSLACRFASDNDAAYDRAPSHVGWMKYGITLVAEQPFWTGLPITRTFSTSAASDFFGAGAPPFTISSGNTLASAAIDNPGDEAAWPVYTLRGPFTSASVGVAGRAVEVPFSMADGESLVIDTRPTAQTAITGVGLERTGDLGAVQFAPIPAGSSVPLTVSMVGTGSVEVSIQALYHRAW
jgi:hypothetical protein